MARRRRSRRLTAEHIQERRRRRRPLLARRTATVALGKSRFTVLREHAFTMMPQGNILGMYQIMVNNVFEEKHRQMGRRCAMLRSEIHERVQQQVSELGQDFHTEREIKRLVNWALREMRREGRLAAAGPGRLRLTRRHLVVTPAAAARGTTVASSSADTDMEAAEDRRLAWLQKRDRHRLRTRMEERYRQRQRRRRQRRASPSSASDVISDVTGAGSSDVISDVTGAGSSETILHVTSVGSERSLVSLASLPAVELEVGLQQRVSTSPDRLGSGQQAVQPEQMQ